MTFWDWIDRAGERRQTRALARIADKRLLANVIGAGLVSGFIGALFALFVIPIPEANEQIVTYMIGQLSGFAGGIVAYHYTQKAGDTELERARTLNTGTLAEVARKALDAGPASQPEAATGKSDDPVHTIEETKR